ncbi:glycerol dehydrogenase [Hapalosiphon sp. MRB220]|nr:glycerol dehydrogenase [Hapalosiphon sp. MRB220]
MSTNRTGFETVTTTSTPLSTSTVELKPSYNIPVVLVMAAIPLLLVQPWVGGAIAIFGLFLMFQTVTLRLQFTATDLDVYRGEKLIRRFPYQEWQNWRIFWDRVPILFYFKEVKSIHFLPILFDPKTLKTCLEQRCPRI